MAERADQLTLVIYKYLERESLKTLRRFAVWVLLLLTGGTMGYMALEGWDVGDSFYMVVITLSTVGFGEVQPLTTAGRMFTTVLILAGVGSLGYLFGTFSQHLISGTLAGTFWSRRMQHKIDQLAGHHVVCGFGRVGRQVARDLERRGCQVVIIESDEEKLSESEGVQLYVLGDASDDDTLVRAGIGRARALVIVTGDDAINLFVTISARALNSAVEIIARANQPSSEPKMKRAGANHVVSPYVISGHRIASQVLNPSVNAFLDDVLHSPELDLWLEEITIPASSELVNQNMSSLSLRERTGANVVALRRDSQGGYLTAELSDITVEEGDVLITLGTPEQLRALASLAGDLRHPYA